MKWLYAILIILLSMPSIKAENILEWETVFDGGISIKPGSIRFFDNQNFGFTESSNLLIEQPITKNLYYTRDGGVSFEVLKLIDYEDLNIKNHVRQWQYASNKDIFILADSAVLEAISYPLKYEFFPRIIKSNDNGANWQIIELSDVGRSQFSMQLHMKDSLNGIATMRPCNRIAGETKDKILMTNDGWNTWIDINTHDEMINAQHYFYGENEEIVNIFKGKIFISSDNGQSWSKDTVPNLLGILNYFNIVNCSTYYIGTRSSSPLLYRILKTDNYGKNWSIVCEIEGIPYNKIDIYQDSIITLRGTDEEGTHFIVSRDNGKTWDRLPSFYRKDKEIVPNEIALIGDMILGAGNTYLTKLTDEYILKPPSIYDPKQNFNLPLDFELKWRERDDVKKFDIQVLERAGVEHIGYLPWVDFDTLSENDLFHVASTSEYSYIIPAMNNYKSYTFRIRAISDDDEASPWIANSYVTQKSTSVVYIEQNEDILIYPNPSANYIEIKSNTEILSGIVQIFNSMGSEMLTRYYNDGDRIDISGLASGLYFVKIGNKVFKIMKK